MSKEAPQPAPAPEAPVCPQCRGTGLNATKKRFCSACLGSGKATKRPFGWQ